MNSWMKGALVAVIMAVALYGCGTAPQAQSQPTPSQPVESSSATQSYTFTDDLGREVTVDNPQRVAALLGSYADLWMLAGGTLCASTDDAWEDFALPMPEDAVNLGALKQLSLEALFSSKPDFVLASSNTTQHLEWQSALEGAGIPVAYFDVACFDDYLRMLKICTDITGNAQNYQTYGLDVKAQVDEILSQSNQRMEEQGAIQVLVLRTSTSSVRAKNSEGTVLGEMLRDMGCENIADQDGSLLEELSLEGILALQPDQIFVTTMGDDEEGAYANLEQTLSSSPLWQQLEAVKAGQVHYMPSELFNMKPNDQWGEAYAMLEDCLYGKD